MNTAAETSRDKGLLENALTMTSFSMPSQADVIEYEITLLTEKQNQIHQHIEELLSEAIERHAELTTVCADIASEVKHYENEYKSAHAAKINARRFHGENSHQFETFQAKFRFCCELHTKAKNELEHAELERDEMQSHIQNMRNWLTGNTPSVVTTSADDLPFDFEAETAKEISRERFNEILVTLDAVPTVEQYIGKDLETIVNDINEGYRSTEVCVCSALGCEVWEHEDLTEDEKTAFEAALVRYFSDVEEMLEEKALEATLPSMKQINAVYHRA